MVVSNELKEPIRSHHDIDRDSAKHFKRASKVCCFVSNAYVSGLIVCPSSMKLWRSACQTMATSLIYSLVVSTRLACLR